MTLKEHTEKSRKEYLLRVLAQSRTMTEAAHTAGCNRTDFYKLVHKYGLEIPAHMPRRPGSGQLYLRDDEGAFRV